MSYQLIPLRIAIIKRSRDKKDCCGGGGTETFAHSLWVGSCESESNNLEMGPILLLDSKMNHVYQLTNEMLRTMIFSILLLNI